MPPSDPDRASTSLPVRWARAGTLGLALRTAAAEDVPFLLHLHVTARLPEFGDVGWTQEQVVTFLNGQAQIQLAAYRQHHPDARWLVVEAATGPVGRLLLDQRAGEIALIDIIVAPPCRGRGFGSALIADILDAADQDDRSVTLHVDQANPARALYRRLGFRPAGDRGLYERMIYGGARARPPAARPSQRRRARL